MALGAEGKEERAIWLRREGDFAVVLIEKDGAFVEVIREPLDGPFSHIVEPSGIKAKLSEAVA